jgi:NADPH:quinone reductase-like Zn-dependent oxidoreductase
MPKAYAFTALGGPEVESFLDLPIPEPGHGQVLIKVRAAGVNPGRLEEAHRLPPGRRTRAGRAGRFRR